MPTSTPDYLRSVKPFGIATELTGTTSITRHNLSIYDHRRWVEAAGFETTDSAWPVWVTFGSAWPQRPPVRALNPARMRFWFGGTHRFGIPHQWILSRPA